MAPSVLVSFYVFTLYVKTPVCIIMHEKNALDTCFFTMHEENAVDTCFFDMNEENACGREWGIIKTIVLIQRKRKKKKRNKKLSEKSPVQLVQ